MDDVLKTDGLLTRLRQYALTYDLTPEWLRSWFDVEQQASHILWFDLSFVPGLMQLEDYVRALLDNENKVVARLKRQSVLSKDIDYVALIDERALRNLVGGPEIMAKQLEHVVELANRLIIQVIPINCGIYTHLDGSFGIATVEGQEYAYADSPVHGVLINDREIVEYTKYRWNLIRAETLPRSEKSHSYRR